MRSLVTRGRLGRRRDQRDLGASRRIARWLTMVLIGSGLTLLPGTTESLAEEALPGGPLGSVWTVPTGTSAATVSVSDAGHVAIDSCGGSEWRPLLRRTTVTDRAGQPLYDTAREYCDTQGYTTSFDPDGSLYIHTADPSLIRHKPTGEVHWTASMKGVLAFDSLSFGPTGGVYAATYDGRVSYIEGFDRSTGGVLPGFPVTIPSLITAFTATTDGLAVATLGSVDYYDYNGKPVHTWTIPAGASGSAATGANGEVFVIGYGADCRLHVTKGTSAGVAWTWSNNLSDACSHQFFISATPDGGAVVVLRKATESIYYSVADGAMRWSRSEPAPHNGTLMQPGHHNQRPIVDAAGVVAIPVGYRYDCSTLTSPTAECFGSRVDFLEQAAGSQVLPPLLIEDVASGGYYGWDGAAIDQGRLYLSLVPRYLDTSSNPAVIAAFDVPGLGEDWQQTLKPGHSSELPSNRIGLASWSVQVGADRTVTFTLTTSGGGGGLAPRLSSQSIIGHVCAVASTGATAYGTAASFGAEWLVQGSTYRVGPIAQGSLHPKLVCTTNALYLSGVDGSSVRYNTPDELRAAGIEPLDFVIPGESDDSSIDCGDAALLSARGSGQGASEPFDSPGPHGVAIANSLAAAGLQLYDGLDSKPSDGVNALAYPAVPIDLQLVGYRVSVDSGVQNLLTNIYNIRGICGDDFPILLSGYSQGADVVQETLEGLDSAANNGDATWESIAGVALFASPSFSRDDASARGTYVADYPLDGIRRNVDIPARFTAVSRSYCLDNDPVCLFDPILAAGNFTPAKLRVHMRDSSPGSTSGDRLVQDASGLLQWGVVARNGGTVAPRPAGGLQAFRSSGANNNTVRISAGDFYANGAPNTTFAWDFTSDGRVDATTVVPWVSHEFGVRLPKPLGGGGNSVTTSVAVSFADGTSTRLQACIRRAATGPVVC